MQTIETYSPGALIIRKGEEANCFYVLNKGAVEISLDKTLLNVVMYPGSILGEVAFASGDLRTANIRARSETEVIKYECESLEALITEHPDIAKKVIETLASRLTRTTAKLAELAKLLN
ncbi:MAG: Crp/Fnr family transcriptional regulator [Opitutaceae bacterium]